MLPHHKTLIPILLMLMVIGFQSVNVYEVNGVVDRSQVNRCGQRVAPIEIQLEKLRPQLVKAGHTLGNALVDPLIALLDDAGRTLDKASTRQITCGDLKPAVDALKQFKSKVTSSRDTIDSQLGPGKAQSWVSQSDKLIKQILQFCTCL